MILLAAKLEVKEPLRKIKCIGYLLVSGRNEILRGCSGISHSLCKFSLNLLKVFSKLTDSCACTTLDNSGQSELSSLAEFWVDNYQEITLSL